MTRRADLAPHAQHCRCARCSRHQRMPGSRWGLALSVLSSVLMILLVAWTINGGSL